MHVANCRRYYHSCLGFIILLVIFTINVLFLKDNFDICRSYLNDLLAMPLLLCYSSVLFEYKQRQMPKYFSWFMFIICSIIWEGIMPALYSWSIADIFDVLSYFIGTIIWNGWEILRYRSETDGL